MCLIVWVYMWITMFIRENKVRVKVYTVVHDVMFFFWLAWIFSYSTVYTYCFYNNKEFLLKIIFKENKNTSSQKW